MNGERVSKIKLRKVQIIGDLSDSEIKDIFNCGENRIGSIQNNYLYELKVGGVYRVNRQDDPFVGVLIKDGDDFYFKDIGFFDGSSRRDTFRLIVLSYEMIEDKILLEMMYQYEFDKLSNNLVEYLNQRDKEQKEQEVSLRFRDLKVGEKFRFVSAYGDPYISVNIKTLMNKSYGYTNLDSFKAEIGRGMGNCLVIREV